MSRLEDRVALVTGAAQGIGAGVSRVLAENGATVVLTDISEAVEATAKGISDGGHKAESYRMDVTDVVEVERVVGEVLARHGRIDILVNNAGIYPRRRLVDMPEEFLMNMFDINVFGIFRCTKAILPSMMERRYGKIINMSSVTGPMVGSPAGGQTAYASSKSAVHGFTVGLALEVAQYGINVNSIMPGYVHSPSAFGTRGAVGGKDAETAMREFGLRIPMLRQGTSEDIGNVALFLASDESSYLTGTYIVVDGGNVLQEEFLGPYEPRQSPRPSPCRRPSSRTRSRPWRSR